MYGSSPVEGGSWETLTNANLTTFRSFFLYWPASSRLLNRASYMHPYLRPFVVTCLTLCALNVFLFLLGGFMQPARDFSSIPIYLACRQKHSNGELIRSSHFAPISSIALFPNI